jgi:hypothetical protein
LQAPPGASRLGLDKLAAIKERERREAEAAAARKRQLEEEEGGEGASAATPSRGGKFIRKEVKDKEFRWGRAEISIIKGTVSRDFLLQVFFMNHLPPSP